MTNAGPAVASAVRIRTANAARDRGSQRDPRAGGSVDSAGMLFVVIPAPCPGCDGRVLSTGAQTASPLRDDALRRRVRVGRAEVTSPTCHRSTRTMVQPDI